MKSKVDILGIKVDNIQQKKLIQKIESAINNKNKTKIFTPNTTIIVKSTKDESLKQIINSADISIPDGAGVTIASRILGTPLSSHSAGIEVGEDIMKLSAKHGYRIFLLGGTSEVSEKAKISLELKYRNLKICGINDGYFDVNSLDNDNVLKKINACAPDIIFVCMGFPRQEKWISDNIDKLSSVKIAIGLGGSLDVWCGRLKRAPYIFRKLSLEWLWRIILEPKRLGFIFIIPIFLWKVIKEKLFILTKINGKNAHI